MERAQSPTHHLKVCEATKRVCAGEAGDDLHTCAAVGAVASYSEKQAGAVRAGAVQRVAVGVLHDAITFVSCSESPQSCLWKA